MQTFNLYFCLLQTHRSAQKILNPKGYSCPKMLGVVHLVLLCSYHNDICQPQKCTAIFIKPFFKKHPNVLGKVCQKQGICGYNRLLVRQGTCKHFLNSGLCLFLPSTRLFSSPLFSQSHGKTHFLFSGMNTHKDGHSVLVWRVTSSPCRHFPVLIELNTRETMGFLGGGGYINLFKRVQKNALRCFPSMHAVVRAENTTCDLVST